MSDLLARLKRETAANHRTLEAALDLRRERMRREEYVDLLRAFRGFIAPWEQALADALPSLRTFIAERFKIPLLDADLAFLTNGQEVPDGLPRVPHLPSMHSVGRAFGSMYVMEGSTLGGRVVGPAMAARFGLSQRQGYAYFDPYGDDTGRMWHRFRAMAEEHVGVDGVDAAVAAARETFEILTAWLAPSTALAVAKGDERVVA